MDLSRFEKITAEEYYTADWQFSEEEEQYAKKLDSMNPYNRHLEKVEAWNLWACYHFDDYTEDTINNRPGLFGTKKHLKKITEKNEKELIIDFKKGLGKDKDNKRLINHINLQGCIIPCKILIDNFCIAENSTFQGASFLGRTIFDSTIFIGDANFIDVTFNGPTSFLSCQFKKNSSFSCTKFFARTTFQNATFTKHAIFSDAKFVGSTDFKNANFSATVSFHGTTFSWHVDFNNSNFMQNAEFSKTIFKGNASFSLITFHANANFKSATINGPNFLSCNFKESCDFSDCIFIRFMNFRDIIAEKATTFTGSIFLGESSFFGTNFKGAVILNGCKFLFPENFEIPDEFSKEIKELIAKQPLQNIQDIIPDFTSTIFTIPPNLNDTDFPTTENLKWWQIVFKVPKETNYRYTATKFRRLKELAEFGKNHLKEAEFFRCEMLSRRGNEVKGRQTLLINAYELVSKCGLSIWRPSFWLLISTLIFASIYYSLYNLHGISTIWHGSNWDFFIYSTHNAIPIFGSTIPEKTVVINTLFGGYEYRPWYFGAISVFQNIISLGLEFLILLGIRNYFRLR